MRHKFFSPRNTQVPSSLWFSDHSSVALSNFSGSWPLNSGSAIQPCFRMRSFSSAVTRTTYVRQQSPHWWQSQFCTVGNDLTGIGIGVTQGVADYILLSNRHCV